jgi:hypothetical protein
LYQHLVQTHSDVSADEIAELEQQHAKCPICLSVFRNNDILRNHMRRHQVSILLNFFFFFVTSIPGKWFPCIGFTTSPNVCM